MDRKYLDKLISTNQSKSWWKRDLFLSETIEKLPKELEIISPPPTDKNYNCFLFMLGLHADEKIVSSCNGFIYDGFIMKLVEESLLKKIPLSKSGKGDYIIYSDNIRYLNLLTHGGILDGNKVISKWAWGPLIKHDVLAVPASYGSDLFYLKSISTSDAARMYWEYQQFNLPLKMLNT